MDRISACGAFRPSPIHHLLLVSEKYGPNHSFFKENLSGFGITLSQLLSEGDALVSLTEDQRKLLERWARLNKDQQEVIFALIDKMQV